MSDATTRRPDASPAAPPGSPSGTPATGRPWRALGLFWVAVLILGGGTAATLQILGPPPEAAEGETLAAAAPAAPGPADTTANSQGAQVPSGASNPSTPPAAAPATVPPPAPPVPGDAPAPGTATADAFPPPVAAPPATTADASPPPAAPDPSAEPRPAAQPPADAPAAQAALAPPASTGTPPATAAVAPPPPAPFLVPPIAPPDPALQEPSRHGPLPRTGADGRTAIRAYARAFPRDEARPRIAVVIGNIGLNTALSAEAIRRLPPAATLALNPYATQVEPLAEAARARGMEMLLALPLEPAGYPLDDPGPRALLTTLPAADNADRLMWAMTRFGGYVGAVGALGPMRGERFAQAPDLLGGVQDVLRDRGLLYVDPRPLAPGAARPSRAWGRGVDVVIDAPATRDNTGRRLAELEQLAKDRGSALGLVGDPSPVLVEQLLRWSAGLEERGLVLAPVTALLRRPDSGGPTSAGTVNAGPASAGLPGPGTTGTPAGPSGPGAAATPGTAPPAPHP